MWLPPGQVSTAVVTCYIPPNAEIGVKDKITFTSQGLSAASQAAILTVTSPASQGLVINKFHFNQMQRRKKNERIKKSLTFVFYNLLGSPSTHNLLELWQSMR